VVLYFVNLATGELYTYAAATIGAHIAFDALKEATVCMRALRGARVMPVVNLSERPMKTNFGMRRRPHFEIIGFDTPAGGANAVPPMPPTPQLTGPATAHTPTPATSPTPQPTQARQPKPPVNLAMGDVKPVLSNEFDDEIPW
jgi:hypothetical protein